MVEKIIKKLFFNFLLKKYTYQQKVDFLEKEAYWCFLDEHIENIFLKKELDFHPSLYECGMLIHLRSKSRAANVIETVITEGRVDELFKKRVEELENRRWLKMKI